jgi:hypothetical protein
LGKYRLFNLNTVKTFLRYCLLLVLIAGFKNTMAKTIAAPVIGTDATLKSIVLSTATTLVYTTGSSDYNYTTSVSPGTATLTIEPTTNDPAATVTVNGTTVPYGAQSAPITLNGIVSTTINMVVTASNGVTQLTYSIIVYESGSNNAYLSSLTVSTGNTLVASSGPSNFNYTTSVAPTVTSLTVTPITADPTAQSVTVNGVAVTSGTASGAITLNAIGTPTVINLVITAQDGVTTQTYSITVSRTGSNIATLSSLSLSTNTNLNASTGGSTFNYTAAVNASVASLTVKPTATDPNSTIKVNGVTVASGSSSGAITLNPIGTTTSITTIVTAQDGTTTESYTITVSRNGASVATLVLPMVLSSNSLLIAATGGPGTQVNYTTDIDPTLTSITETATLTDPNASFTVNGITATSGSPSSPITLNPVGSTTTITALVKSQDGSTTKTYAIVVSRNGSNDANLANLTSSTNTILNRSGTTYTTSVPTTTTSLTLTPTADDPTRASITINGVSVASGTASGSITLNAIGTPTNATVVVTSQDGLVINTFTVVINRTGSNNANIGLLSVSNNGLLVSSGLPTNTFAVSLDPATTSFNVTATTSDPSATFTATVTINGVTSPLTTTGSGNPFAVTLNPSPTPATTTVNIVVTAPDGVTTKTYTIIIYKNGCNNPNLVWPIATSPGASFTTLATGPYSANYTAVVSPNATTLTVTPTTVDPNTTITVNGLTVADGTMSNPIPLNTTGTTLIVIVVTAQDKVTVKSYGITVSKTGGIMYWTGGAGSGSPYWDLVANWNTSTGKVPGPSDEASIGELPFTVLSNMPQIRNPTSVSQIVFGNYYAAGTTLGIGPGLTLTVGTGLTVNTGAIASIWGVSLSSEVDISSSATLNINPTGTLRLNIAGSNTSTPIVFKLKSNSSGSASVGQITSSSITYNNSSSIQVERYIQGGSSVYRGYRLLSSPVYKSADVYGNKIYSLNYVQGTSLVTGITGPSGGFDATGNPSLYLFREDVAANGGSFTGGNYWGISNLNFAPTYYLNGLATPYSIPVGEGFFFFFRGDRTTNLASKYSPGTSAESVTMVTSGILNAGPITVHDWYNPGASTLSYTTTVANGTSIGLHLIGNPYASSIDWDTYNSTTPGTGIYVSTYTNTSGSTVPAVGNTIYIIDPVSKNYGVYIANSPFGGTNNATHVIPSGQGFFIQSFDPSATLTFNESAKTSLQVYGANLLLGTPKQNIISQYLHLKLLQNDFQADEIFVSFNDNAQSKFVLGEDAAQKPGNGIASLASMSSDGVPLSINTLNLPAQSVSIPLNVNSVSDGTYQLTMPDIKSIPSIYEIWLMDAYKKDSVDFRNNPSYSFNISKSDAASYGSSRFTMVIRQNPALGVRLLNFDASKASNGAEVTWKTVNEQNYTNFTVERSTDGGVTFNVLGGFVSSSLGTYSFLDKDPLMTANRYRLKLADLDNNISYSNIVTLIYGNSNNVAGNINVYPNPTSGSINLTITPFNNSTALQTNSLQTLTAASTGTLSYGIKIINITGAVIKTAVSSSPVWQDNVSSLSPGTYIIQVVNNSNNSLVGKSTFVKL